MEPQRHPNPLYAYEVLEDSSYDLNDESEEYVGPDEFDQYWEQMFHALAVDGEDFNTLWEVYENSKKRKREEEIDWLPAPIKKQRFL